MPGAENYPHGGHFNWMYPYVKHLQLKRAIDIGGMRGNWCMHWHNVVECIEVFEPNPDMIPELKERIKETKNIRLHQTALGNTTGTVSMQYQTHPGTFYVKNFQGNIPITTLDSFNFTDVSVIKIDVEGFEVPVLEGARETILSNRPWIQVEANETGQRYGRPKIKILETLSSFGMRRVAKEWPDQIWSF